MPKRDYSHVPQVRIPSRTRDQLNRIRELERRDRPYGSIIADLVSRRLREIEPRKPLERFVDTPRGVSTHIERTPR